MKTLILFAKYWSIRAFFLIIALLIFFGGYFYSVPQCSLGTFDINNPVYNRIKDLPTWRYSIEYIIYTFLIISVILVILIGLYKFNKINRKTTRDKYLEYFAINIVADLYSEREYTESENKVNRKKIEKAIRGDYAKRLIIKTLSSVRNQTVGVIKEKSKIMYYYFRLDYFIYAYLHSPSLRNKLFALKVISDFHLVKYESYIVKLTKRKNDVLRSEALVTLIKLNIFDNLLLLNKLNLVLSLWDINNIIKTVLDLKETDIDYLSLINSEKKEVAILGIMLARLNEQHDLKIEMKKKIGNPNQLVNEEAFLAYISLDKKETNYSFLINEFGSAPDKAKKAIIYAIESHPDRNAAIHFLEWVVENETFVHKIEALLMLMELDLNVVSRFKFSENKVVRDVCAQVLDINM